MGDLAMGFVRGGPTYGVRHFTTSLKEAARLVETFGKRDLSDGHRWAEAMGTVGHGTASQLIQARMDAAPGAVQHASLLNKFYHKVGIEQLTQGGRIAATNNAKIFLDTLAHDQLSGSARTRQRATLYLKELGIADPQRSASGFGRARRPPKSLQRPRPRRGLCDGGRALRRPNDPDAVSSAEARLGEPSGREPHLRAAVVQRGVHAERPQARRPAQRRSGVKTKDPALLIPASGLVVLVGMNALQMYLRTAIFGGKGPDDDPSNSRCRCSTAPA
jgi:hypothetical protein